MQIFLDSASVEEIKAAMSTGFIDGVTTNPSLLSKEDIPFETIVKTICDNVGGDVSVPVTTNTFQEMLEQGRDLASLASNVVVKVPATKDGLLACKALRSESIPVNVTLCFSTAQAILAAKAGANYVSPFIGRLDDVEVSGAQLIKNIAAVYDNYHIKTHILAASIRTLKQFTDVLYQGVYAATIPYKLFEQLFSHPFTKQGLKKSLQDWTKKARRP